LKHPQDNPESEWMLCERREDFSAISRAFASAVEKMEV
jgi:hypothetical protein